MIPSLLHVAQWASDSSVGIAVRDSIWLFPVIEAIHLLALALLGGMLLIVDLRLCGVSFGARSAAALSRDVWKLMVSALVVMLITGSLLYASEALKCYGNPAFKMKMICLGLAIAFTFTVRAWTLRRDSIAAGWGRLVGIASMLLWLGVGAGGRGIGFY
jgi:hypothetical protein